MPAAVSPAEWEVLNVVLEKERATAQDVHDALAGVHDWSPKTVGTFLTRLVGKGVLKVRREGKANVYSAKLPREEYLRAESESFLRRVFRGATAPLLLHFVEQAELSKDEIRELERVLRQKKKTP